MSFRTYMCSKSNNPNYMVHIKSSGFEVIADMPEETTTSLGSEWEAWFPSNGDGVVGNAIRTLAGTALRAQIMSTQTWTNSSPVEIPLELLFDAESNPQTEVYEPMRRLEMMALPSMSGNILYAPGPAPGLSQLYDNTGSLEVELSIGRMLHIPSVVITSVQSTFSSRLTQDGKPIAGRSSINFRTSITPSRQDWEQWTGI